MGWQQVITPENTWNVVTGGDTQSPTYGVSGVKLLGLSTGVTTLLSANDSVVNYTINVPAANDTITLNGASQTLTNKTISGASNTITNISLTSAITGILPAANGGTGIAATGTTGTGNIVFSASPTFSGTITAANINTTGNYFTAAGNVYGWTGRSLIFSPSDGTITITNNAETGFGLLQFGGQTSSFPAFQRNGAALNLVLADGSGFANLNAGFIAAESGFVYFASNGTIGSSTDGLFLMRNNAGTDFGRLQFGGTTSSFPALKRSGAGIDVRLADDSNYASIAANSVNAVGDLLSGATSTHQWNSRSVMTSPSDGIIRLTNQAQTDFGRLQFGGTTSSYPALKRNGAVLEHRLADDSGYAGITAATPASSDNSNSVATTAYVQANAVGQTTLKATLFGGF